MNVDRLPEHAVRAATVLKALGNDRRLMILCALADGERTVGDLEARVGLGQSALSQHLARLRRDGLVETRRAAQHIHYRLSGDEVMAIIETLARLYCPTADPTDEPSAPAGRITPPTP